MTMVFRYCRSFVVNLTKEGENFNQYRENRVICHECTRVVS